MFIKQFLIFWKSIKRKFLIIYVPVQEFQMPCIISHLEEGIKGCVI